MLLLMLQVSAKDKTQHNTFHAKISQTTTHFSTIDPVPHFERFLWRKTNLILRTSPFRKRQHSVNRQRMLMIRRDPHGGVYSLMIHGKLTIHGILTLCEISSQPTPKRDCLTEMRTGSRLLSYFWPDSTILLLNKSFTIPSSQRGLYSTAALSLHPEYFYNDSIHSISPKLARVSGKDFFPKHRCFFPD